MTIHAGNQLKRAALAMAAVFLIGCDDDLTRPATGDLTADVSVTPDTIGIQEPIRLVFNRAIDPATALDPANFVVTNLCDTLRVPGSVRLSGDTLIFSPSEALPFLTLLSVRVQNILDLEGNALPQPITFQRVTSAPPVRDASWHFLNSPTGDLVTGISFATPDVGYLVTFAGAVYRTVSGGVVFGARYKNPNITSTYNIQTFGGDTVLMIGAELIGGGPQWSVFRSLDSAATFQASNTVSALLYASHFQRVGNEIVGAVGGQTASPALFKYHGSTHQLTTATRSGGGPNEVLTDVTISSDTNSAVATVYNFLTSRGSAYLSVDGGESYSALTLPTNPRILYGAGFVNNGTALLVGDSSEVMQVDVQSGTVTRLGASAGIPQSETSGSASTVFTFTRVRFVPGDNIGWITGYLTRRQPGTPDVVQGVILQSRDGGSTWTRQAIAGAPENGLAFPVVRTSHALSRDFVVLGGLDGLVAARTDDSQPTAVACSFNP